MKHSLKLTLTALLICSFATPQVQAMDYARSLFDSNTKRLIWALTAAALTFVGAPFYHTVKKGLEQMKYAQYKKKRQLHSEHSEPEKLLQSLNLASPIFQFNMQGLNKFISGKTTVQQEEKLPIWNRIPVNPTSAFLTDISTARERLQYLNDQIDTIQDNDPLKDTLLKERKFLANWNRQASDHVFKNKPSNLLHAIQIITNVVLNYWNQAIGRAQIIEPASQ